VVSRLAGGRIRKPIKAGPADGVQTTADNIHSAEAPLREAVPELSVPVSGLALPDRAAGSIERVGSAGDPAEVAAEATARSIVDVLRTVNPAGPPAVHQGSGDGAVRRSTPVVGAEGGELDAGTSAEVRGLHGTGRPLPTSVRRSMESAFGTDLSDVRVHTGDTAARLNASLQSTAFTTGRDIAFADGMPDTRSRDGQHLLAHELAHVLQNRGPGPIRRTMRKQGVKQDTTFADLLQVASVRKASAAIRYVLRYWETSANQVTYTSATQLLATARAAAANMDAAFTDSLQTVDELDEFEKALGRLKLTAAPTLVQALAKRRQDLSNVWGKQLAPNYFLPNSTTPSHYSTPTALLTSQAQTSGRDDGAWVTTTNPITGAGGVTTGSTNADLLVEAKNEGSLFKVGDKYEEICKTCGRVTLASQFEVDHQQAFSEIRDNLIKLASAMTMDASLYQSVQKGTKGFNKLFEVTSKPGKTGFQVTALGAAVHLYSNDMQNLMRICRSCNGPWGKSDMAMVDWFRKSPYFGQEFLDAYSLPGSTFQVIARTKQGTGWGTAAKEWFANYHLPILKNQQLMAHLSEMVRQRLTEQSTTGVKAAREGNPTKKQKLQHETEQLGLNNEALLGSLEVERDYHSGTLLGQSPYQFAPNSPGRMKNEHIEVKKKREKRKRSESLARRPIFTTGRQDGCTGKDTNRPHSSADQDELDAYQLGYDEGFTQYVKLQEQGAADALTAQLDLDVATLTRPEVYLAAFKAVFEKRVQAFWDGNHAFTDDTGLDFGYATGDPHAQTLLRDYMFGYEDARQESKKQTTTTTVQMVTQ